MAPAISSGDVKALNFAVPNYIEQVEIGNTLADLDHELAALETKLTKYQSIKQGMMQNLLTGNIRLI